ncbi:MAG TPA: NUDIX hydrolase [Polyangiaceae bacterium]|jgi:ADP-ribose pyrophosphatase
MSGFTRSKTERIGVFPFFELLKHEQVEADGRRGWDAYTFVLPDWVSVVAVTADGDFVLVRQYRAGIDSASLEAPGGLIDPGEQPAVAALRELREETGYGGGTLISLGSTHPNPVLQNNRHHMFLLRDAERLGEPELDEGEHLEVVMADALMLRDAIRDGTISHALVLLTMHRAFDFLAGDPRFTVLRGVRGER